MTTTRPHVLTEREAAAFLKVKPKTLKNWRIAGKGPNYSKLEGTVRYDLDEVASWFNAQRRSSTTEPLKDEPQAGNTTTP